MPARNFDAISQAAKRLEELADRWPKTSARFATQLPEIVYMVHELIEDAALIAMQMAELVQTTDQELDALHRKVAEVEAMQMAAALAMHQDGTDEVCGCGRELDIVGSCIGCGYADCRCTKGSNTGLFPAPRWRHYVGNSPAMCIMCGIPLWESESSTPEHLPCASCGQ